jgi:hypothetical protein
MINYVQCHHRIIPHPYLPSHTSCLAHILPHPTLPHPTLPHTHHAPCLTRTCTCQTPIMPHLQLASHAPCRICTLPHTHLASHAPCLTRTLPHSHLASLAFTLPNPLHCKSGLHKYGIRKSSRKTYNLIMGI